MTASLVLQTIINGESHFITHIVMIHGHPLLLIIHQYNHVQMQEDCLREMMLHSTVIIMGLQENKISLHTLPMMTPTIGFQIMETLLLQYNFQIKMLISFIVYREEILSLEYSPHIKWQWPQDNILILYLLHRIRSLLPMKLLIAKHLLILSIVMTIAQINNRKEMYVIVVLKVSITWYLMEQIILAKSHYLKFQTSIAF